MACFVKIVLFFSEDAETLSTTTSYDDVDVMSDLSATSSSSSTSNEMRPQVKKQLTKEEVRDAVALINECLSDQEMRSGSMTPVDSPSGLHGIVKGSESSFPTSVTDQTCQTLDADEPNFAPNQPDYHSAEVDKLYADKSPEYALPERDVIHKSVATRTAEIRVQNTEVSEKHHDIQISKHPVLELTRQMDTHSSVTTHNSSVDSGRDSTQDQIDSLRKTTSTSDVDSGIDGSALSASKIEIKAKAASDPDSAQSGTPKETVLSRSTASPASQDIPAIENNKVDKKSSSSVQASSFEHPGVNEEEDEEERKVREEIENTQRRLAWLHEQQVPLLCCCVFTYIGHSSLSSHCFFYEFYMEGIT